MKRCLGLIALLIAPTASLASTAPDERGVTLWVKGYPITRGGILSGCSFEYNAVGKDYIYNHGQTFSVVGNISLNKSSQNGQDTVYGSMKVILQDLDGSKAIPHTPAVIHLVSYSGVIASGDPSKSFTSDMPGSRVQPFLLDDNFTTVILEALSQASVTIAFNRDVQGTDIHVPLDLTVKSVNLDTGAIERSHEMIDTFSSCLSDLIGSNSPK